MQDSSHCHRKLLLHKTSLCEICANCDKIEQLHSSATSCVMRRLLKVNPGFNTNAAAEIDIDNLFAIKQVGTQAFGYPCLLQSSLATRRWRKPAAYYCCSFISHRYAVAAAFQLAKYVSYCHESFRIRQGSGPI